MGLPQPTTRSPGFLQLDYTAGTINHKISQRLLDGVDPTDSTLMGGKAADWANILVPVIYTDETISGYRVLDASRVELYPGVFSTAKTGTLTTSGLLATQSFTQDIVGRGVPGGGLAQGNTRHMWFQTYWASTVFSDSRYIIPSTGAYRDLLDFLNLDDVIGADFYGSKAVFNAYSDLQFNAHYQKRYGF